MKEFDIVSVDQNLKEALQYKIDHKTKPVGSLGRLEEIAVQIGLIQNILTPVLKNPHLLVFAGDHGLATEGVSAYPQEVTWQMVLNFISGGAAINVFCRMNNIHLKVIDAGVKYDFKRDTPLLTESKIRKGTSNALHEPAMSFEELTRCIQSGAAHIRNIHSEGSNCVGLGEMGIGNTSSAALLMSTITGLPIEVCAGQGTGLSDEAFKRKITILTQVINKHGMPADPYKALATFGGFEIAQMVGAILQAAESRMIILIDGFISSAAYLMASKIEPAVKDYSIFCHQSHEQGHRLMLDFINAKPILNLNMRLGEGTGVAMAYPIIQAAVTFLNEMASFEAAHVSQKSQA